MALEVVWADEANEGLDEIIEHLKDNWTDNEIHIFFTRLEECPFTCPRLQQGFMREASLTLHNKTQSNHYQTFFFSRIIYSTIQSLFSSVPLKSRRHSM